MGGVGGERGQKGGGKVDGSLGKGAGKMRGN